MQVKDAPRKNCKDLKKLNWAGLVENTTHSTLFKGPTPDLMEAVAKGMIPVAALPQKAPGMDQLEKILKGIQRFEVSFARVFTKQHSTDCHAVLELMREAIYGTRTPCQWSTWDLHLLRGESIVEPPPVAILSDVPPWRALCGEFYAIKPLDTLPFFLVEVKLAGKSRVKGGDTDVWGAWVMFYWPQIWRSSSKEKRAELEKEMDVDFWLNAVWEAESHVPKKLPGNLDFEDLDSFQQKVTMKKTKKGRNSYLKRIGERETNRKAIKGWVRRWSGGVDMHDSDQE